MAQKNNEVVVAKSNVLSVASCNVELPNFKEIDLGNEPRRLKIKVTNGKKADGTKFKKVTGYVKLPIYEGIGDDATYVRDGIKRISVHFKQVAFKEERGETCNVSDINDLQTGYLFVKAKGLRIPSIYKLQYETDDNGEIKYAENGEAIIKYPEIWVEKGVLGFLASVTSQNALDVDSDTNTVDAEEVKMNPETGELLNEEYDTEECMFGEDSEVEDEE